MTTKGAPSYADLVYDVLRTAGQPLTFQEIFDRVNQRRPVTTKNPKGTIRGTLTSGRQLVSLGDGRYGYLPRLVTGSRIRLPLAERKPANQPLIFTDEIIQALWPSFFENQKRQDRRPARARLPNGVDVLLSLDFLAASTWGCPMPEPLRRLLIDKRAAAGDSLVLHIVDGEAGTCEISLESRLKRDNAAMAARNRQVADAVAQIYRERGTVEMVIWDLVIILLARRAYHSEPAPDPLELILRDETRFGDAGFHHWIMTEAMTPAKKAEIDRRRQSEREMLAAFSGQDDPIGPLGDAPFAMPFTLERTMQNLRDLLAEHGPDSVDELNALVQEVMTGGNITSRQPTTPIERAQDIMYDAWEARSPQQRIRLARRALEISEDCADAYVLLAEEEARTPREAADLYARGVAAGERALGPEMFEDAMGEFWGILETRPYMRARLGLAQALLAMGEHRAAIEQLHEMLRLNPGDNQGVRYLLLSTLLDLDEPAAIQALLDSYPDEVSAAWTYGRVLQAYRRDGDTPESRRLRAEARRWNPHVPAYLSGQKRLPRRLPDYIGMGDESEAIAYAAEQQAAWRATPGALAWLDSGPR